MCCQIRPYTGLTFGEPVKSNVDALETLLKKMQIREEHSSIASALPKAARVLQDLRGVVTYEADYSARHPFAAYNISLESIGQRFTSVITCLNQLEYQFQMSPSSTQASDLALLEATDHLLDSLMEHMDVCGGIIRNFCPASAETQFKKQLASFKTAVNPYRKHIACVDNYIKHNQGKLRSIRFSWASGMCFGYFVEGPIAEGGLGPVECIHPGSNSAFSFNRDLKFHICSVFAIGAELAHSLHEIDKRLTPLPIAKSNDGRDSAWGKAVQAAAKLPNVFFPDEILKPVPVVKISNDKVLIDFAAHRPKISQPPSPCKIGLTFGGDGVTRTFKMPYFDGDG